MAHFCGRAHSTRDRRTALADESRPRNGDRSLTAPSALAPAAAIPPANSAVTPGALGPRGATRVVTHERIAALAYSYWEARGRQGGSPEADWLRAEKELRGS